MAEKEHWIVYTLNHFKLMKSIVEDNLKRDEKELEEREERAKENGVENAEVPEGYIDRDKQLREGIESSKGQLKEYEKVIEDIYKASYFVK